MRTPRVLRISWREFDRLPLDIREHLRDELERFMAEMDMQSFKAVTGDDHPNSDYEYVELTAIRRKGNYK